MYELDPENGILARVPGRCVSEAILAMPDANTSTEPVCYRDVDAEHMGRVRIFARRMLVKHYKHRHWFWAPYRAEPMPDDQQMPKQK